MKKHMPFYLTLMVWVLSCGKMGVAPSKQADYIESRSAEVVLDSDPSAQAEWSRLEATASNTMYEGKSYRILNTSIEMVVKDFNKSLGEVKKIVKSLEGQIASTQSRQDDEGLTSGSVEVKIPADRYDQALQKITKLGEVRYTEEKSEDVTKEFVDLKARLENAKKLEKRILHLLENQTGTIEDVMNVEKELASVREKIEELEGRKRYLENKINYSTITVSMYEKGAKFGGELTPGDIFKEVINKIGIIFVGSFGILIVVIVGALPWLAALAVLGLVIRSVLRRRKKKQPQKA